MLIAAFVSLSRAARYESTVIASAVLKSKLRYSVLKRPSNDFLVGNAETVGDKSGYSFARLMKLYTNMAFGFVSLNIGPVIGVSLLHPWSLVGRRYMFVKL